MPEALWAPYRLFPYELRLGERELLALGARQIERTEDGCRFDGPTERVIARATYFHEIRSAEGETPTDQAMVEFLNLSPRTRAVRRQSTRFGLHGLHEYKGKFNPQVVRALCNVVDADAQVLIDPFCGSGTSLLEGIRLGMDVLGVDRSPIAALISQTKLSALLYRDHRKLRREFLDLAESISLDMKEAQQSRWKTDLSRVLDQDSILYIQGWFPDGAVAPVASFINRSSQLPRSVRKLLCQIAFSSILREISLQRPEDLRVRRRAEPFTPPPVWELFMEAAEKTAARLEELASWPQPWGRGEAFVGSADSLHRFAGSWPEGRRLILTSPPYATALPYIDTDRFSLIVLGLASSKEVRRLEAELIGSREWNQPAAKKWAERLAENRDGLPEEVVGLVRVVERLNAQGGAGFRRKAVPTLLYRYFARMGQCFDSWARCLRSGERAVVIVGGNKTTAGGEQLKIATPDLLGQVAEQSGFILDELIPLETWPRYGLHARNGVDYEKALILRRV